MGDRAPDAAVQVGVAKLGGMLEQGLRVIAFADDYIVVGIKIDAAPYSLHI